jgi:hypothetical protein
MPLPGVGGERGLGGWYIASVDTGDPGADGACERRRTLATRGTTLRACFDATRAASSMANRLFLMALGVL